MNTLKLSRSVSINGEQVHELRYDFEAMTARDIFAAISAFKAAGGMMTIAEMDSSYHIYLFAQAVAKADKTMTIQDVMLISGKDAAKAAYLARDFFYFDSEVTSPKSSSEKPSPVLQ